MKGFFNLRRSVAAACIIAVCVIAAITVGWFAYKGKSIEKTKTNTAMIISAVMEQYPETDDAKIIKALNGAGDPEKGMQVIERFGYDAESLFERTDGGISAGFLLTAILSVAAGAAVCIALILLKHKRQAKKIVELTGYIQDINRGIYDLKVNENSEDAFSKLTNGIYKNMILLQKSSEAVKEENEKLSAALEDISHQLKTPLTAAQIMLDNMADDPEMDPGVRQAFIRDIDKQISGISSLIISLLDMAKFDSGTMKMNPKRFRAGELIGKVTEDLGILLEVKGIMTEISGDTDAEVELDKKWQSEALKNIVKNAAEHSPEGSRIFIGIEDTGLFIKITIRDEGCGMTAETVSHIFERFYKAPGSSEDSAGIGLAFAKTVIEQEGGMISVDSEPGHGSTFTVRYKKTAKKL